jgi:hypothetical protein
MGLPSKAELAQKPARRLSNERCLGAQPEDEGVAGLSAELEVEAVEVAELACRDRPLAAIPPGLLAKSGLELSHPLLVARRPRWARGTL